MTETFPRFIVHDAAQMDAVFRAAAETGQTLVAQSAPGASATLGAGVFLALGERARKAHGQADVCLVLDCADDVAGAMNALRLGASVIRLAATPATREKISDMAARSKATVEDADAPPFEVSVDLADNPDAFRAVMASLTLE